MKSGYVINTVTGKALPIEKLEGEELNVVFQTVLVDEDTGERVNNPGGYGWPELREGARYHCEKEWLLMAGLLTTLAAFKTRERACAALETVICGTAEGAGVIYIESDEMK